MLYIFDVAGAEHQHHAARNRAVHECVQGGGGGLPHGAVRPAFTQRTREFPRTGPVP